MTEPIGDQNEVTPPLQNPLQNSSEENDPLLIRMMNRLLEKKLWVWGTLVTVIAITVTLSIFILHHLVYATKGEVDWTFIAVSFLAAFILLMCLACYLFIKTGKAIWRIIISEAVSEGDAGADQPPTKQVAPIQEVKPTEVKEINVSRPFLRPLFTFICCLVLGVLVFFGVRHLARWITTIGSGQNIPPPILHSNFVPRRICDTTRIISYANRDLTSTHDTIDLDLQEGCYGDWVVLPQNWDQGEVQLSQNPGDYVSIWCNGNPSPYPIVEPYTRGVLDVEMSRCHVRGQLTSEFHVQGHGTLTLVGLTKKPPIRVNNEGYRVP